MPPIDYSNPLTDSRHAVWNAINTWAPFEGYFKTKYTFDDNPGKIAGMPSPSIGQMPAIAIDSADPNSNWNLNQYQQLNYPLTIVVWIPHWKLTGGEWVFIQLLRAFYQNFEPTSGNINRVNGFTGFHREIMMDEKLGVIASRWMFQVSVMSRFWNPSKD